MHESKAGVHSHQTRETVVKIVYTIHMCVRVGMYRFSTSILYLSNRNKSLTPPIEAKGKETFIHCVLHAYVLEIARLR